MRVTLYQCKNFDYWQHDLEAALIKLGFNVSFLRSGIFAYHKKTSTKVRGIEQADGFQLIREPIGVSSWALGIKDHRKYFESKTGDAVKQSEQVLFGGNPQKYPIPIERVKACVELGAQLGEVLEGFSADSILPDSFESAVHQRNHFILGNGQVPIEANIGRLLKFNGFLEKPECCELTLLADDPNDSIVLKYANNLERGLRNYGLKGSVTSKSFDVGLSMSKENLSSGKVCLLALSGSRGTSLEPKELAVMDHLDGCEVPYRMFSINNPELFWSSLDQVGVLAMLAGGIPYRMNLNWPANRLIYSVGVDLGHPLHAGDSRLAVSLMAPDGQHINTFVRSQKRDETADSENLFRMLRETSSLAKEHAGKRSIEFLVLRDGRRNAGESLRGYLDNLSPHMTLVDVSKRVNAYAYSPSSFAPGVCGDVLHFNKGGATLAITAPSVTGAQIPMLRKIRIDNGWDGLQLGREKVAEVICSLAFSPALGFKPHGNPGPVYWADGAASISDQNCLFRGIAEIKKELLKSK
ncbi:hypothetical protein OAV01_05400 [Opitutales bacterium]|nr:hypothetical protein [Opitutales bacterium]